MNGSINTFSVRFFYCFGRDIVKKKNPIILLTYCNFIVLFTPGNGNMIYCAPDSFLGVVDWFKICHGKFRPGNLNFFAPVLFFPTILRSTVSSQRVLTSSEPEFQDSESCPNSSLRFHGALEQNSRII